MHAVTKRLIRASGFTLVELMIVVVVSAILAGLAVPTFRSLIEDQRIKAAATELHAVLTQARSEAIKRNANITVSPKSGVWQNGWEIPNPAASGALLEDHPAVPGIAIAGPTSVTYQSSGRLPAGGSAIRFTLSASHTSTRRCVEIELSGRPTVMKSC